MVDRPGSNRAPGFGHPSWPGTGQDCKVAGFAAATGSGSPDGTLATRRRPPGPGQGARLERLGL